MQRTTEATRNELRKGLSINNGLNKYLLKSLIKVIFRHDIFYRPRKIIIGLEIDGLGLGIGLGQLGLVHIPAVYPS